MDGAADGYLSGAIGGFISGGLTSKACFIAGTLVHAECGLVPIEEIQADQMVWAEDPETGERALKRVVRTLLNEKDELVHVQVNGETITCTTEHPFYVQGKGWVAAKDLKINDKLDEPIHVYNFEVEDFHAYFVGAGCVLVHNMCKQQTIAAEGKYSAKASVSGENSRHVPHAHIFEKSTRAASVNVKGEIIVGTLDRAGKKFVKRKLAIINTTISECV